jgi:dephospho-CoA kinase
MLRVGLTGGIGSGKSTVARLFRVLGAPVFEADTEARWLMTHDAEIKHALTVRFGESVYRGDELDRSFLAARVFGHTYELQALNAIVHPAVRERFVRWCAVQKGPYAIMEAALMAENEGYRAFDKVITVSAGEELRIQRVIARDGTTEAAVRERMVHQASEVERQRIAHFTVLNDGTKLVIPQVLAIHNALCSSST